MIGFSLACSNPQKDSGGHSARLLVRLLGETHG